jgi:chromate reductase
MTTLNILGISGSLRTKSMNTYALQAAGQLMPEGMKLTITSLADIPLYNQDVQDQGIPASVTRLCDEIARADGLLIASPEYNFSISGVLKNAIDWLSRTPVQPFKNKPVALLSATGGPLGGARNQYDVRKILGALDALVLLKPEIFMGMAQNRFDAEGKLTDAATTKLLSDQMIALQAWIARVKV